MIAASKLGRRNFQVTIMVTTCPQVMAAPNISSFRLPLLSLRVFVCVLLQWLYPQRRQAAAVWRKRRRRGTANLPQGQRNSSSLKWVSTPNRTFITYPLDETRPQSTHAHTHRHVHGDADSFVLCCFRSWSVPCLWRKITDRSGHLPSTTLTTTAKSPER